MGTAQALTRLRAVVALTRLRAVVALALGVALAPGTTAAQSLRASVACRDGAPNGAYELRDADGQLRAAGAYAKGRRTGTFIFWNARGARIAVVPYDDDRVVGTVALWYAPRGAAIEGGRKLEAPYHEGVRHGLTRSWHDNGRPRAEIAYERGAIASARAWRRDGAELRADDALRLAQKDAGADDAVLADLQRMLADSLPSCATNERKG